MSEMQSREILKSNFAALAGGWQSDQQKGEPNPPLQKPPPEEAERIELPAVDGEVLRRRDLFEVIRDRRSRRKFTDEALDLDELAWLLWTTAGVHRVVGDNYVTMRTVPSVGARHPYETYLLIQKVEGVEPGLYRYLPIDHQLLPLDAGTDRGRKAAAAALNQGFLTDAAVVFYWAAVPYRCEWRYGPASYKAMLLDAGHIAQNLYLSAESIGCGCCAIAAYDQQACDELLGLDGEDEFTVYLAPVGRVKTKQ